MMIAMSDDMRDRLKLLHLRQHRAVHDKIYAERELELIEQTKIQARRLYDVDRVDMIRVCGHIIPHKFGDKISKNMHCGAFLEHQVRYNAERFIEIHEWYKDWRKQNG